MRMRANLKTPLLLLALALLSASISAASTRPVHAQHAIVVSVNELASRAGAEIMQAGGNAVDAAVATGFTLAVVHSPAGNIGGGGFMLIRMADGKAHFIDYREKAPAAATREYVSRRTGQCHPGRERDMDIRRSEFRARLPAWFTQKRNTASSHCSR